MISPLLNYGFFDKNCMFLVSVFLLLLVIYGVVTKVPGIFSAFAFPQLSSVVMPKM